MRCAPVSGEVRSRVNRQAMIYVPGCPLSRSASCDTRSCVDGPWSLAPLHHRSIYLDNTIEELPPQEEYSMENFVLFTLNCELEMRSKYDGVYLPHSLSCGGDNVIVLDVSIITPQVDFHSNSCS